MNMSFFFLRRHGRAFTAALFLALFFVLPARAVTIQEVVSPKGVRAWLVQDDFVPLIAIRFSWKGGTTQDPAGKEGLANLMTGLFDEGAGDLPSDAFQERLDNIGAEMSFSATADDIGGSMRMLAENRDAAFDLLSLAVNRPRFDQGPLDRIRQQIITNIKASERDPNTIAAQKFAEVLYGNHPYARREQGTEKSLMAVTRDDLLAFHRRVFARDNLTIGVVGSISPQELGPLLDKIFGNLPEKADLTPVPDAKLALGATTSISYKLPQTSIALVYPGVSRKDPEFFAAHLMNHILGGGSSSRLYREVREKRGLAYSVDSALVIRDHASALTISTATRPDRAQETLQIIRDEVSRMANEGPTEQELAEAKSYVIGSYAVSNLDSSSGIARTLVGLQQEDLGRDYIDKREGIINSVTLDQVKAVAKRLLQADPAILMVGPAQM